MGRSLVILTGASGSGKTAIAAAIEVAHPEYTVFRFDTIGVPSPEVRATYGTGHEPGGAWQRAMTLHWFERIAAVLCSGGPILFEGQMRVAFIQEALQAHDLSTARVILLDCDDATRAARLHMHRRQPELANESMFGWARYLRGEASEAGYEVIDTGAMSLNASVARIVAYLAEDISGPRVTRRSSPVPDE